MYVNNRLQTKWTQEKNLLFISMWGVVDNRIVCEKFEITEAAASQHAWKLGLPQYGLRTADPEICSPLGPLEFAPGHVAVDQQSFDHLRKWSAMR